MMKKKGFGMMAVLIAVMLVGVLSFGFVGCDNGTAGGNGGGSEGGGGGGGGGGGNIPSNANRGWPSSSTLTTYGLSGLPQVSGASNIWWDSEMDDGVEVIGIAFQVSSDPTSFYRSWFTSNGFMELGSNAGTTVFFNIQTGAMGSVHYDSSEGWGYIGGGIER